MSARVLIVDDVPANVRLLQALLEAEYFEVHTAMNGPEALDVVQRVRPDIVLLDVMMPGMDGFEVCRRIKANPLTRQLPVILITALDQPEDRNKGFQAGADDYLVKPIDEMTLLTRLRALARFKFLQDELESSIGDELLLETRVDNEDDKPARLAVLLNEENANGQLAQWLREMHEPVMFSDPVQLLEGVRAGEFEGVLLEMPLNRHDTVRICSQIRAMTHGRQIPVMLLVHKADHRELAQALEVCASDYLNCPISRDELAARLRIQLRRWRYIQRLRESLRQSVTFSMIDPLTGLYNRRYLFTHGRAMVEEAAQRGRALSVLVMDLDYFKKVNDTWGHDAGDAVLQETAKRLSKQVRKLDVVCRIGGEEFAVLLSGSDGRMARMVAERLRCAIASKPFKIPTEEGEKDLHITISIGLASFENRNDTLEVLLKRADDALYQAKQQGRNRVIHHDPSLSTEEKAS